MSKDSREDEDDEGRWEAVKKEVINEEFLTVTGQVACRQPFNGPMEEVAGWGEKLDEQECVGIELTSSNFSSGLGGRAQRECVH